MEINVLGPLEVHGDSGPVAVPGLVPRALLPAVSHSREAVTVSSLVDGRWGVERPRSPSGSPQIVVSRLREALGSGGQRLVSLVGAPAEPARSASDHHADDNDKQRPWRHHSRRSAGGDVSV